LEELSINFSPSQHKDISRFFSQNASVVYVLYRVK
jgi:hypothetical protein